MPAEYLKTLALHRALMRYLQNRVNMLECLHADDGAGIVHEAIAQDIAHTAQALQLVRQFVEDCT